MRKILYTTLSLVLASCLNTSQANECPEWDTELQKCVAHFRGRGEGVKHDHLPPAVIALCQNHSGHVSPEKASDYKAMSSVVSVAKTNSKNVKPADNSYAEACSRLENAIDRVVSPRED